MANKTELIRQRMAQKREALNEKLDALEDRTLGVVQETTEAVVHVAESVEDTVQSARRAVKKTVKKSAKMFDLNRQVDRHPWLMMGGAVAAGLAASWLMSRGARRWQEEQPRSQVYYSGAEPYARDTSPARLEPAPPAVAEEPQGSGWLGSIMEALGPSIDTLKQMAIGTTLALGRDLALQSLPPQFSGNVNDLFRSLGDRLGAEDLPEPEAGSEAEPRFEERGEATEPRWEQERHDRRHGKRKSHGNGRHREAAR